MTNAATCTEAITLFGSIPAIVEIKNSSDASSNLFILPSEGF